MQLLTRLRLAAELVKKTNIKIYADLDFVDADDMLAKALFVTKICHIIERPLAHPD